VAVDGHTDNVPIQGALKKKFPTNKELSESRAANAAKALTEGGLGAATTHGYAETKPAEPNTTASGRAKNRCVEVRVTKERFTQENNAGAFSVSEKAPAPRELFSTTYGYLFNHPRNTISGDRSQNLIVTQP
jgi:hypothetical protein